MVERKEVEAMLAACQPGNDAFGPAMDEMTRRKMRALCRAWLAVQDAPRVKVRGKVGEVCMVPVSHDFCGQRVRIVKEQPHGP